MVVGGDVATLGVGALGTGSKAEIVWRHGFSSGQGTQSVVRAIVILES